LTRLAVHPEMANPVLSINKLRNATLGRREHYGTS